MTTEICYDFVTNVSQKNETLFLEATEPCLAAGVWTMLREGCVSEARLNCLRHVAGLLCGRDHSWERWVILGHRAIQPNSRIVKYWGIRKYLRKQGICFNTSEFIEQAHEYEDGLQFVGATRWEMSELEAINAMMMTERAVIVLMNGINTKDIVNNIIANARAEEAKTPFGILNVAAQKQVIVIDVYGEFDDREVAVAAIGRSEVLQLLGIGENSGNSAGNSGDCAKKLGKGGQRT